MGIIAGLISGGPAAVMDSLIGGAGEAVTLCLSLAGAYMLWMGLMRIAEKAGLVNSLAKALHPVLKRLFPDSPTAVAPVTLNLAANFLGVGSAATPFGLAAMQEFAKTAKIPGVASDDMVMFLSLNSSAIELFPATVLALRVASGSADAYNVVLPTFIASIFAFISAIIACKVLCKLFPENKRKRRNT